jgi:hypothetical protein
MAWTLAHMFLLEWAQELDIGTSLLLDPIPKLKPWKFTLAKKGQVLLSKQVDFYFYFYLFLKLTNRLNFKVEYEFLLVVELHAYIDPDFNLILLFFIHTIFSIEKSLPNVYMKPYLVSNQARRFLNSNDTGFILLVLLRSSWVSSQFFYYLRSHIDWPITHFFLKHWAIPNRSSPFDQLPLIRTMIMLHLGPTSPPFPWSPLHNFYTDKKVARSPNNMG